MVDMRPQVGKDRYIWGQKLLDWIETVIAPEGGINTGFLSGYINDTLNAGTNISLSYDDLAGQITITNLITDEVIRDTVNALVAAGDGITVAYDDMANTLTISGDFTAIEAEISALGMRTGTVLNPDGSFVDAEVMASVVAEGGPTAVEWVEVRDRPPGMTGWADVTAAATDADNTGATDATTPLNTVQNSGEVGYQRTVYLPQGDYGLSGSGLLFRSGLQRFKGDGMYHTRLTPFSTISTLLQSSGSFRVSNILLEDIGIDCTDVSADVLALFGEHITQVAMRRVGFFNLHSTAPGILGYNVNKLDLEACEFWGTGGTGHGIGLSQGVADISIRDSKFRWLRNNITIDTGSSPGVVDQLAERIVIDNVDIDGFWWLIPSLFSNSGGTVTYTGTTLTDSAAAFTGMTAGVSHNIRAMPVRGSGSGTTLRATSVALTGASFISTGVLQGEIVAATGKRAIISEVQSQTQLRIEGWYDTTTGYETTAPVDGTAIMVYGVLIGEVTSFTGTEITTPRWWDLTGATVTPTAGDRYEVMKQRPNYPILIESGARDIIVRDGIVRRGWSDQVAIFAPGSSVTGMLIEHGQDMGITLESNRGWGENTGRHLVTRNRIHHQGASSIALHADDSMIAHNILTASQWENPDDTLLGSIYVRDANRNQIESNVIDGLDRPLAYHGVVVSGDSDGNRLLNNPMSGHATADIRFDGAGVTNTYVEGEGSVLYSGGATGQYLNLRGTANPAGTLAALPGSTYRRTGPNAGVYFKESGDDFTGWAKPTLVAAASDIDAYMALVTGESGIQSYWPLDEASGPTVADAVGAIDGTESGSVTYRAAGLPIGGYAITLPGWLGFDLGDVYDFTGTAEYSLEIWVNQTAGGFGRAWSKWDGGTNTGYMIRTDDSGDIMSYFHAGTAVVDSAPSSITLGTWHHIAAERDATDTRLYIDGVQVGSATAASQTGNSTILTFGYGFGSGGVTGRIAHPAIYSTAKGAAVWLAHYEAGMGL